MIVTEAMSQPNEDMTMFTTDNSTFDTAARRELNAALELLLADVSDRNREQAEKSYSDLLNNAWFEGATTAELVAAVKK
jgi:hypothetical protein